ncbi:SDR family NAD(P)-dependent oxidoreductase [Teredinibacter turnerae]|uniref:SDR family NAD(P)-dependent oxidoreductase n=1 Tax=Teredinibacter turnerae TaxID=2426 RepID=UPI0003759353|nr:SDR family NAD(P)-dependent oxidoreductase [Teredinibacter turnerae]
MRIVVIGAGAIGRALVSVYAKDPSNSVYNLTRREGLFVGGEHQNNVHAMCIKDVADKLGESTLFVPSDESVRRLASEVAASGPLDRVIVATGMLHSNGITPEKSLKALSYESLSTVFRVNAFYPAMVAKHFIPLLAKHETSVFAALSARVGSIEDNHLGGWYAYRASKAALNMLLKTASIEARRANPNALVVGLHPGTVDSDLSQPFQSRVPKGKLFSAEFAAQQLQSVVESLGPEANGRVFAWDGRVVPY